MSTGNVVITSPYDDAGGVDAGAVYLFNGATGALISTLRGSSAYDKLGRDETGSAATVVALSNGNFVVRSLHWDNGSVTDAGAVTWGSGITGVSGVISSSNSLVGSSPGDQVGRGLSLLGGVVPLNNGNYVVCSSSWDNGSATDAGAVTWGNGLTGVTGVISSSNSLIGSSAGDQVGRGVSAQGVVPLNNGNYVVCSSSWDNGSATDAGAVTLGNGLTGVTGVISSSNSLVGSSAGDQVGGGFLQLSNGNFLVLSSRWDNGTATNAGAVTWVNATLGIIGAVSSANSLVGSSAEDTVGASDLSGGAAVSELSNGNYVVRSRYWDNGAVTDAGAVTWGNGLTGVSGVISSSNSLVGSSATDSVGYAAVVKLNNGNYVICSPFWNNGSALGAGAVTWGNGMSGLTGEVSSTNSLIGATANDQVGSGGVVALSNGNYVVITSSWDNATISNAGAATWGSGTNGTSGFVSTANSLVGTRTTDRVGSGGVVVLSNGNYVVLSPAWDNGTATEAGAATWGNGATGVMGEVTSLNSLVGSSTSDEVGGSGITVLGNGSYVVKSPNWNNGGVNDAGAVTWGSGSLGVVGAVSSANSLVGSSSGDRVGAGEPTINPILALRNGNYVVASRYWDNGAAADAGAVTWGSGTAGVSGVISSSNSLVGSKANDLVGEHLLELENGHYVVASRYWDNGAATDAGAVTWGSGTAGVTGVVSSSNSLVGSKTDDKVGGNDFTGIGIAALSNGNFVVHSPKWDNGPSVDAGAVTWVNGAMGMTGVVSSSNSLVGLSAGDQVGYDGLTELGNGNYLVVSRNWDNGSAIDAGALTWGSGTAGITGMVSGSNSIVGQSGSTPPVGQLGNKSLQSVVLDPFNGTYFARFRDEGSGKVRLGHQGDGLAPNLISLSPSAGSISGENSVTFVGKGFTSATAITLGGIPATDLTLVDYNTLTAIVPAHAAGTVDVSIITSQGMVTGAGLYTYVTPGIRLTGNGIPIANHDSTPVTADHTDFGPALVAGSTVERTFTVENIGTVPLKLTGTPKVMIGGVHAADFTVTSLPASPVAAVTTFQVTFDPNGMGLRTATLSIANDSAENPYTFTIQGTGDAPPAIGPLTIASSNAIPSRAKLGDMVTISFTASEPIQPPSITLLGVAATVSNLGGNDWTAFSSVIADTPEGIALFSLTATDLAGYTAAAVTNSSDGSSVLVDKSGPAGGGVMLLPSDLVPPSSSLNMSFIGWSDASPPLTYEILINNSIVATQGSAASHMLLAPAMVGTYTLKGRVYDALGHVTETLRILSVDTVTAQQKFDAAMTTAGLSGPDAQPTATPRNDGVANLLKYAFNMDLNAPDVRMLSPGGTAGLPSITRVGNTLRLEYLRRIGSGLIYTPQKRAALDTGTWQPLTSLPVVTPVLNEPDWERAVHEEPFNPAVTPRLFGRVEVTLQ